MSPRTSSNVDLALGEAAAPDRIHHDGVIKPLLSGGLIVQQGTGHEPPAQAFVERDHGLVTHQEPAIHSHVLSHEALSPAHQAASKPATAPTLLGDDAPSPSDGDLDTAYAYHPA